MQIVVNHDYSDVYSVHIRTRTWSWLAGVLLPHNDRLKHVLLSNVPLAIAKLGAELLRLQFAGVVDDERNTTLLEGGAT